MPTHRIIMVVLLVVAGLMPRDARGQTSDVQAFTLHDVIGRTWRDERVHFPLSPPQLARARARLPLLAPDGSSVPYQIVLAETGGAPAIEFLANVNPFTTRAYRFAPSAGPPLPATEISVKETADSIIISNSSIGIVLRKKPAAGQGPIEAIRLASGRTIGNSLVLDAPSVESYRVDVSARGPVSAEVVCTTIFTGGRRWEMRFTVQAHDPVVLVDETTTLDNGAKFQLLLSPNFDPDTLYYRYGKGIDTHTQVGKLATWAIPTNYDATVFVLEPWLHWWERERQGTWFGLYQARGNDLLAIAARAPARWVSPGRPDQQAAARTTLTVDRAGLKWTLPFKGGARAWMIEALDRDASLAPLASNDLYKAPLPQQYLVKHSDFPLDRVKDYVLTDPGDASDHPRLIVTKARVDAYCKNFKADAAELARLRRAPLSRYRSEPAIVYFLCTGDPELGHHLADTAVAWMQGAVDILVQQGRIVSLGFAPHDQTEIISALELADVVWSSPELTSAARARLAAQAAFLGYTVDRDDYWSPERGFAANPNMTTTVAAYRALIGALIPQHPRAKAWLSRGVGELEHELETWADADGGWLEAPHYAMVSYDYLLGVFLAARNAGFSDALDDPRMRKVMGWFAKISTPPDPRLNGHRHLPPIGNTYVREPSGEFAIAALLWRDKDPDFAAQMQWMSVQQGAPEEPGIGGFYPALAGFRAMLRDPAIAPRAPAYRSEPFAETGVMLRSHFASDRETQLYLIAGRNHAHYDMDSGGITFWGKGRVVADDFGYEGYMPGEDHNIVVAPGAPARGLMHVEAFSAGEALDYVRGTKNRTWTRQIALVKDSDPLGPNYAVIADSIASPGDAVWRLWFTASTVTTQGRQARAAGADDVDTDIVFTRPRDPDLATETKTRQTSGMNGNRYGAVAVEQIGIIAHSRDGGFAAVLYPRLKNETPPAVSSPAPGVTKIVSATATDYVFLAPVPFSYRDRDIAFSGTVGLARRTGADTRLALGAAGSLSAFGKTVERAN